MCDWKQFFFISSKFDKNLISNKTSRFVLKNTQNWEMATIETTTNLLP